MNILFSSAMRQCACSVDMNTNKGSWILYWVRFASQTRIFYSIFPDLCWGFCMALPNSACPCCFCHSVPLELSQARLRRARLCWLPLLIALWPFTGLQWLDWQGLRPNPTNWCQSLPVPYRPCWIINTSLTEYQVTCEAEPTTTRRERQNAGFTNFHYV